MCTIHSGFDLPKVLVKGLLCVLFRIVKVDPVFARKLNRCRILLDLVPISLVPHVSCGFAGLLHGLDTIISALASADSPGELHRRSPHLIRW